MGFSLRRCFTPPWFKGSFTPEPESAAWNKVWEDAQDAKESLAVLDEPEVREAIHEDPWLTDPVTESSNPSMSDVLKGLLDESRAERDFGMADFTWEDAQDMKFTDAELDDMGWYEDLLIKTSEPAPSPERVFAPGRDDERHEPKSVDAYAYAGMAPPDPDKVVGAWHPAAVDYLQTENERLTTLVRKLVGKGSSNYRIWVDAADFDCILKGTLPETYQDEGCISKGEEIADTAIEVNVEFTW